MGYIGNIPALDYISYAVQNFTVTAGTTVYTLDYSVSNENDIRLVINNVIQRPGASYGYSATGTTLTLTSATNAGDTMYAVFIGRAVQTVVPPANINIQLADGTAAAPSLNFANDTNTGIFRPTTDTTGFTTNGAEAMRIDSNGNVSIGTTSGDVFSRGNNKNLCIFSDGAPALQIRSGASPQYPAIEMGRSATRTFVIANASTKTEIAVLEATPLTFQTDSTERMRIDSSGNVLVGTTTSPSSPLAGNKYIKLGTPSIEGNGTADVSVSTTDVSLSNAKGAGFGFVGGYNTSGGAQFNVIVHFTLNGSITVVSSINNTGLTLTFSAGSGILKLKTSSGTVATNYTVIGA